MTNILLLGGTGWLGKTLSVLALDSGQQVTALARGTQAFATGVNEVIADRTSRDAYDRVENQVWDLVIELTSSPTFAREALQRLGGKARNRVFIASCSVYAEQSEPGGDETADVVKPLDPDDGGARAGPWPGQVRLRGAEHASRGRPGPCGPPGIDRRSRGPHRAQ